MDPEREHQELHQHNRNDEHHHHVFLGALGEGLALGFLPQRHFGDGGCLHGVGAHCAQHEDLRDEVVEEEELDHVALGDLLEVLHDVDDVVGALDVPVPGSCDDGAHKADC